MQTATNSQIIENQPVQRSMLEVLCHLHNKRNEKKRRKNGSDDGKDKSDKIRKRENENENRWLEMYSNAMQMLVTKESRIKNQG